MILADKITEERKKNGWSQEELADKLGVSRQAVSKWESAGAVPQRRSFQGKLTMLASAEAVPESTSHFLQRPPRPVSVQTGGQYSPHRPMQHEDSPRPQ